MLWYNNHTVCIVVRCIDRDIDLYLCKWLHAMRLWIGVGVHDCHIQLINCLPYWSFSHPFTMCFNILQFCNIITTSIFLGNILNYPTRVYASYVSCYKYFTQGIENMFLQHTICLSPKCHTQHHNKRRTKITSSTLYTDSIYVGICKNCFLGEEIIVNY